MHNTNLFAISWSLGRQGVSKVNVLLLFRELMKSREGGGRICGRVGRDLLLNMCSNDPHFLGFRALWSFFLVCFWTEREEVCGGGGCVPRQSETSEQECNVPPPSCLFINKNKKKAFHSFLFFTLPPYLWIRSESLSQAFTCLPNRKWCNTSPINSFLSPAKDPWASLSMSLA